MFGLDSLRYYMLSEATPDADTQICADLVITKMNADLANALGNLLNRCTMPKILPEQCFPNSPLITKLLNKETNICKYDKEITELIAKANALFEQVDAAMEDIRTKNALLAIFSVVY